MTLRVRSRRPSDDVAQRPPPAAPTEPVGPAILGFPAEVEDDDAELADVGAAAVGPPGPPVRLAVARRADPVAGTALLLAGGAAAASLWLPWIADGESGAALVRRGLGAADVDDLLGGDGWPPVGVLVSGAALVLVGLLLFRRARTHRAAGVLALLAAVPATAGVLLLCADAGWDAGRIGAGLWCAVAVAALGLLGALKAMLTLPRVTAAEGRPAPA